MVGGVSCMFIYIKGIFLAGLHPSTATIQSLAVEVAARGVIITGDVARWSCRPSVSRLVL